MKGVQISFLTLKVPKKMSLGRVLVSG
jgi:hypothetical protein